MKKINLWATTREELDSYRYISGFTKAEEWIKEGDTWKPTGKQLQLEGIPLWTADATIFTGFGSPKVTIATIWVAMMFKPEVETVTDSVVIS